VYWKNFALLDLTSTQSWSNPKVEFYLKGEHPIFWLGLTCSRTALFKNRGIKTICKATRKPLETPGNNQNGGNPEPKKDNPLLTLNSPAEPEAHKRATYFF